MADTYYCDEGWRLSAQAGFGLDQTFLISIDTLTPLEKSERLRCSSQLNRESEVRDLEFESPK